MCADGDSKRRSASVLLQAPTPRNGRAPPAAGEPATGSTSRDGGLEVVGSPVFGYARGVKRRSPLEVLSDLRRRAHDGQQAQLAARIQAEKVAQAAEAGARNALSRAASEGRSARSREAERLKQSGITAAEGQWRVGWEQGLRQSEEQLARALDGAVRGHRAATLAQQQAQSALSRADADLKLVQGRLAERALSERRRAETTEQETSDEAALRRYLERKDA
jgi:hypothetical protein